MPDTHVLGTTGDITTLEPRDGAMTLMHKYAISNP